MAGQKLKGCLDSQECRILVLAMSPESTYAKSIIKLQLDEAEEGSL